MSFTMTAPRSASAVTTARPRVDRFEGGRLQPSPTASPKMLRQKICGGSARVGLPPMPKWPPSGAHKFRPTARAQELHEGRHRSPTARRYRQLSDGVWSMAKLQVRSICLKAPQIYVVSIE